MKIKKESNRWLLGAIFVNIDLPLLAPAGRLVGLVTLALLNLAGASFFFCRKNMPLDLAKIRKRMGDKSQAEIALAAGMARPNFARVLSGKFDPKLSTVERVASALGCKVADILQ